MTRIVGLFCAGALVATLGSCRTLSILQYDAGATSAQTAPSVDLLAACADSTVPGAAAAGSCSDPAMPPPGPPVAGRPAD